MRKPAGLTAFPPDGFLIGEQILPDGRMEQEKKREKLQTSGKHVKYKDILGEIREKSEIPRRPHQFKAGPDIVDRSGNSREGSDQVRILKGDQEDGQDEQNDEGDHINIDRTDHIVIDRLVIHLDLLDALRVDIGNKFLAYRLKKNDKS